MSPAPFFPIRFNRNRILGHGTGNYNISKRPVFAGKSLFKTGRIRGFSNRNAADDAEAVWRSHKKKSAKNYSLDRQTTSSQIGEITGVKRNCFLKNLQIVCRFLRMSFFCACPGISPQRCSACPHRGGRGRIISHSDGHSVFNLPFNR